MDTSRCGVLPPLCAQHTAVSASLHRSIHVRLTGVMTVSGWLTIVLFAVILTAVAFPLGSYMAKVYTGKRVFLSPILAGPERLLYGILRVDPKHEQDWKAYAKSLLIFSLAGWLLLYLILRTQNAFYVPHAAEPAGVPLGAMERHVQHRLLVPDKHQLAVLQRRDHDVLPQPDDRAHRPELALGRRGHRRCGRLDTRDHRAQWQGDRQFLGGLGTHDPVRACADLRDRGDCARLPGGHPELHHLFDGTHDHRTDAIDRDGPGRLPRGRSRSLAPTAAASSTSTRPTRSRIRRRSPISSRCCSS